MEAIVEFLLSISNTFPILTSVFAVLYTAGLVFQVTHSALREYVLKSPSTSDDILLEKVESHKKFKAVKYVMDLLLNIKVK